MDQLNYAFACLWIVKLNSFCAGMGMVDEWIPVQLGSLNFHQKLALNRTVHRYLARSLLNLKT